LGSNAGADEIPNNGLHSKTNDRVSSNRGIRAPDDLQRAFARSQQSDVPGVIAFGRNHPY